MRSLVPTCEVVVLRPVAGAPDALGAPTATMEPERVPGVLFAPGSTSDLGASRPEGARAEATFHFPQGYSERLDGCEIEHAGRTWRVVGSPVPFPPGSAPGPFCMAVKAVAVDG